MKKNFKRRDFIKKAGVAAAAATAVSSFPAPAIAADRIEVNCVATWGRGYPGLGTGGEAVSQRISDLSDGRIVHMFNLFEDGFCLTVAGCTCRFFFFVVAVILLLSLLFRLLRLARLAFAGGKDTPLFVV